ncbi:MAG: hypothetical protein EAZ55_06445 [Cytophagales bacterium]|nr:MAG: hypothetical protein EAZ55_06445 [Cytophagales bacterium]
MKASELQNVLTTLEKKIHKLVLKCNTLKKEHDKLVEENIELKEIIKNQNETIENLRNQENFTNIVASMMAENGQTGGFKKQLNRYIEDVEQCILHLSK